MTIYALPNTRACRPASMLLYQTPLGGVTRSPLTGDTKTVSSPGGWWSAELTYPDQHQDERGILEGLIDTITRSEHRLQFWNVSRPQPRGNCNLSGVTVGVAAGQFAQQVTLYGCGAGRTLTAGDMLGIGGQLCRVAFAATANASGQMTVQLTSDLRQARAAGTAVVLDRPTALFVAVDPVQWPASSARRCPGVTVQLVEVSA